MYLKESLNCQTAGLVYLIRCHNCQTMYVGETSRKLHQRITEHRSDIHTSKPTQIAKHFNEDCPSIDHLTVIPLEHVPRQDLDTFMGLVSLRDLLSLLRREQFWIDKLGTRVPSGLNKREELPPPIPFIQQFHDQAGNISQIIRQAYNQLQNTQFGTYRKFQLVLGYRRNTNLKDMLISAA